MTNPHSWWRHWDRNSQADHELASSPQLEEQLRAEHRHDLHQILAYAALYEARHITSMLVYPMRPSTWERLSRHNQTLTTATLRHGGRNLTLALAGLPLQLPAGACPEGLSSGWDRLRVEPAGATS